MLDTYLSVLQESLKKKITALKCIGVLIIITGVLLIAGGNEE